MKAVHLGSSHGRQWQGTSDVTMERQKVQATKHHLERTLTAIVKKGEPHYLFLSNSWANPVARPCSKSAGHTVFSSVKIVLKRPSTQKLLSLAADLFLCKFPCVSFYLALHIVSLSPMEKGYMYINAVTGSYCHWAELQLFSVGEGLMDCMCRVSRSKWAPSIFFSRLCSKPALRRTWAMWDSLNLPKWRITKHLRSSSKPQDKSSKV